MPTTPLVVSPDMSQDQAEPSVAVPQIPALSGHDMPPPDLTGLFENHKFWF